LSSRLCFPSRSPWSRAPRPAGWGPRSRPGCSPASAALARRRPRRRCRRCRSSRRRRRTPTSWFPSGPPTTRPRSLPTSSSSRARREAAAVSGRPPGGGAEPPGTRDRDAHRWAAPSGPYFVLYLFLRCDTPIFAGVFNRQGLVSRPSLVASSWDILACCIMLFRYSFCHVAFREVILLHSLLPLPTTAAHPFGLRKCSQMMLISIVRKRGERSLLVPNRSPVYVVDDRPSLVTSSWGMLACCALFCTYLPRRIS
jgi:hypothetical protein